MAYVPSASDITQPTGDKFVASAAPEFRAVKSLLATTDSSLTGFQAQLNAIIAGIGAGNNSAALAALLASSAGAGSVGFIQSLAGAQYKTLLAKGREVVSVFDFGAVADGNATTGTGTDNSPAFQTAINAIGPGGVLFVPIGVYKLATQIILPSKFTLCGAGNYSTILFAPAAFNDPTGLVKTGGAGGPPTIIEDMCITGQVGGAGLVSLGINALANGTFLKNLWVGGFQTNVKLASSDVFLLNSAVEETLSGGTGVSIVSGAVTVANCTIYNCYVGIFVSAAVYAGGTISISNVRSSACFSIGFLLQNSSNVQLSNCSAAHNTGVSGYTGAGLEIDICSNILVDNFVASLGSNSAAGVGVKITASNQVQLTGGYATAFYEGINCSGTNGLILTGFQAKANVHRGIVVTGGDKANLTGCTASDNGLGLANDAGIWVDNTVGTAVYTLTGNITVGGGQQYGLWASAGATSYINIIGHMGSSTAAVANINLVGTQKNIIMEGCNPVGGIGSAATPGIGAAAYTVGFAEKALIGAFAGTMTITLPAVTTSIGRILHVSTVVAQTMVSATANVAPVAGGASGTAILAAAAGKWATLICDGTAWRIMANN